MDLGCKLKATIIWITGDMAQSTYPILSNRVCMVIILSFDRKLEVIFHALVLNITSYLGVLQLQFQFKLRFGYMKNWICIHSSRERKERE